MAENDLASKAPQTRQIPHSEQSGQSVQSQGGKPNSSAAERSGFFGGRLRIDKTQATIILCGLYLFFSLAGNIAATKVTYFGSLVMDAGFIYSLTFTWRDLIHKQLGQKAAITTIWLAAGFNLLLPSIFNWWFCCPRKRIGQIREAKQPGHFSSA